MKERRVNAADSENESFVGIGKSQLARMQSELKSVSTRPCGANKVKH